MTIQKKANELIKIRAKIAEAEEKLKPLKEKRSQLDQEMMEDLTKIGFKSVKTEEATISIGNRKTLKIVDEEKVIKGLKEKGLRDLVKEQIYKPLWLGFASQAVKEEMEIDGTELNTTEFISIRKVAKKGEK